MVRQWLSGSPLEEFLSNDFGRAPRMGLATAWGAAPLLDWKLVSGLLQAGAVLRLGRDGSKWRGAPPRSMLEAHKLLREGWSMVLHRAELYDEPLRRLAESVRAELGGHVSVQVGVHPKGLPGFGWQREDEHLFVVQSCGTKVIFFRETVSAAPRAWRLSPGDWLYLPAGWPYACGADGDSLSLRVCVRPYSPLARRSSKDTNVKPRERMESTSSSRRSSPPSVAAS
jgi:hypothetical protein